MHPTAALESKSLPDSLSVKDSSMTLDPSVFFLWMKKNMHWNKTTSINRIQWLDWQTSSTEHIDSACKMFLVPEHFSFDHPAATFWTWEIVLSTIKVTVIQCKVPSHLTGLRREGLFKDRFSMVIPKRSVFFFLCKCENEWNEQIVDQIGNCPVSHVKKKPKSIFSTFLASA